MIGHKLSWSTLGFLILSTHFVFVALQSHLYTEHSHSTVDFLFSPRLIFSLSYAATMLITIFTYLFWFNSGSTNPRYSSVSSSDVIPNRLHANNQIIKPNQNQHSPEEKKTVPFFFDISEFQFATIPALPERLQFQLIQYGEEIYQSGLFHSLLTKMSVKQLKEKLIFDPTSLQLKAKERFQSIQQNTHCIFAKKSKSWASRDWDDSLSFEENLKLNVIAFLHFCVQLKNHYPTSKRHDADDEQKKKKKKKQPLPGAPELPPELDTSGLQWNHQLNEYQLDAFVFEIRGKEHLQSPETFGQALSQVLQTLQAIDPISNVQGIDKEYVRRVQSLQTDQYMSSPKWHFSFLQEPFFITSFAPFYSANHPRYMFIDEYFQHEEDRSDARQSGYVLFQPELSFLRHDLAADHAETHWDNPKTERDRIRINFKKHGRPYYIPPIVAYPAAFFVVSPLDVFKGPITRWWKKTVKKNEEKEEKQSEEKEDPFQKIIKQGTVEEAIYAVYRQTPPPSSLKRIDEMKAPVN